MCPGRSARASSQVSQTAARGRNRLERGHPSRTEPADHGAVSASYSSSTASSGVLTVTSGGSANVAAVIDFIGHYMSSNFHIISGVNGTVEIFDPPLAGQPPAATVHSANLAVFANYLAASFPAAIGHGGVLITDGVEQAGLQPLFTHPLQG
jgi:hypothetical protein